MTGPGGPGQVAPEEVELLHMECIGESDVFAVRQRGREVAAALGMEQQDQVRVATALSEVGREVLPLLAGGSSTVRFALAPAGRARLVVTVPAGPGATEGLHRLDGSSGIAAARRLLDEVVVHADAAGARLEVRLVKALPRPAHLGPGDLERIREHLTGLRPATLLDELRAQNGELVQTLDQLAARQQDLLRANEELEATNQGVLAMYTQLSQELDDTNRGVVALYAELDSKGQQLVEADEAKTRFLRNISHELRTPVTSILGLADLLAEAPLEDEQRVQVDYLRGSAATLLKLVNELLDLARVESGRQHVQLADVDLAAVLAQLRGSLRPVADARGLRLTIPGPTVATLRTDGELLSRVLRNLLMNALKFTEHGEVGVTVTPRSSGQHVDIAVTDTGVGIPAEDLDRIFEEFYQVPGRLQRAAVGTGLGLPYARRVTEALGGTLTVSSVPGEGSCFTVTLPSPVDDGLPEVEGVRLGHVLLVDDDPAFRHVVRGLLQGVARRVSEADDGEAALALAERARPDVVLLDLRMPVLDGPATLAALRAHPTLHDVPVVLLTSVDIDADVRRAVDPAPVFLAKTQLTRRRLLALVHEVEHGGAAEGAGA